MKLERFLKPISLVALLFIALFITTIAAFILRGYYINGRLPIPYNPDPATIGFHHTISLLLIVSFPFVALLGLTATIWAAILKKVSVAMPVTMSLLCTSIMLVLYIDPFQLFEWIMD